MFREISADLEGCGAALFKLSKSGVSSDLSKSQISSPACRCVWLQENPKHVLMFCPDHAHNQKNTNSKQREQTGIKKFCRQGKDSE